VITPRGTIRLQVAPEVSSLDYSHAVVISGFTIPALSTRRVQTEVELDSGQSFVIAGLMDNTLTDTISKIPGLGDIPLLGKLFQTKAVQKNNSELLVIVTPEIVRPMPVGMPLPELERDLPFLPAKTPLSSLQQPGLDKTGMVPVKPKTETVPVEMLQPQQRPGQAAPAANTPTFQLLPIPATGQPSINPGLNPPAMPPNGGTGTPAGSGTGGGSGAGGGDGK
jgi:pilus assembly protein CpaC